jgi:hypothetical protein
MGICELGNIRKKTPNNIKTSEHFIDWGII